MKTQIWNCYIFWGIIIYHYENCLFIFGNISFSLVYSWTISVLICIDLLTIICFYVFLYLRFVSDKKSFPGGLDSKESACNAETQVWFLDQEDPLEKGMITHSTIFAWKIPWIDEPCRLQSMGLQRVRHDWATNTFTLWLKKKKKIWKLMLFSPLWQRTLTLNWSV